MKTQSSVESNTKLPPVSGLLQRQCDCGQHTIAGSECKECGEKKLQRSAINQAAPTSVPPIIHEVLSSAGHSLDPATRAFMEPRFGHDFSRVKVHTDAKAAESAQSVSALAYTVGRNIVFGAGHYDPSSTMGKKLLAHELAHTVQQRQAADMPAAHEIVLGSADSLQERDADSAAQDLSATATASASTAPCVQRKTWDDLPVYEERPDVIAKAANRPGTWEFTQNNVDGSTTTGYSSSVSIKFHPNKAKVNCDEISFVQNVRTIDTTTKIANEPRANFKNRITGTGWTIDRVEARENGWYGYNNDGKPSGIVVPGNSPNPLKSAEMTDRPNWNIPSLIWDFEACAICKAGTDVNRVLGCLTWGFDADSTNKVKSHPTGELSAPSAEFAEAIKKWNQQTAGPAAQRNDPHQKPLGPFK